MPPRSQAGGIAGIAGLTFASFTAVSFFEVKRRIDEQVAAGEEPYQLRVEKKVRLCSVSSTLPCPPRPTCCLSSVQVPRTLPTKAGKKKATAGKRKK